LVERAEKKKKAPKGRVSDSNSDDWGRGELLKGKGKIHIDVVIRINGNRGWHCMGNTFNARGKTQEVAKNSAPAVEGEITRQKKESKEGNKVVHQWTFPHLAHQRRIE